MYKYQIPGTDALLSALNKDPLGKGEESVTYKIAPDCPLALRVSLDIQDPKVLRKLLTEETFVLEDDIFEGRNYGQTVAYVGQNPSDKQKALVALVLLCDGFSMDIYKSRRDIPPSEVALRKTIVLSENIANKPDAAFDKIYDDLHFLSSRQYSIDTYNGGWCTNTGNILLANKQFNIIDIMPFIRERAGINLQHTKGNNTPFYLAHGLIPGAFVYTKEHSKDKRLIELRTEIIHKIIEGAKRNKLNDLGGYSNLTPEKVAHIWQVQLAQLNIEEKYIANFAKDISSVVQEDRYPTLENRRPFVRACSAYDDY